MKRRLANFLRKVEGRFFEIGKKTSIMSSVFLHKNVQHAVDERWISWGGWTILAWERKPTESIPWVSGAGAGWFGCGRAGGEEE